MSLWDIATAFVWLAIAGALIIIAVKWAAAAVLAVWALYTAARTTISAASPTRHGVDHAALVECERIWASGTAKRKNTGRRNP